MATAIGLSQGLKTSLYSLQDIQGQIDTTNQHLSTGKKVNSALDNALNYFLAQGFQTKATNYSAILDNINLGINTLTQANSALTSITTSLQQALGTLKSALNSAGTQAKATAAVSFKDQFGNAANSSNLSTALVTDQSGSSTAAFQVGDKLTITLQTYASGANTGTTAGTGGSATLTLAAFTAGSTVQNLLNSINSATVFNAGGTNANVLTAFVNDAGNLVVESNVAGNQTNTTTVQTFALKIGLDTTARAALTGDYVGSVFNFSGGVGNSANLVNVSGTNSTGVILSGTTQQASRAAAAATFRQVLTQISSSAADAGYNGTNLLNGDFSTVYTNDSASTSIVTQGSVVNSQNLGFTTDGVIQGNTFANLQQTAGNAVRNFQSDSEIKAAITTINNALGTVTQIATNLTTNSNLLQNRQAFTTSTVRNFQNGSDQLTLADINQEGANLSSLQTKQQLAVQALSLANRSDQSILRLFG